MSMAEICRFDYSGRTVLVTGGTAGIGLAIARAYRDAGASVFVTGRSPDRPIMATKSAVLAISP